MLKFLFINSKKCEIIGHLENWDCVIVPNGTGEGIHRIIIFQKPLKSKQKTTHTHTIKTTTKNKEKKKESKNNKTNKQTKKNLYKHRIIYVYLQWQNNQGHRCQGARCPWIEEVKLWNVQLLKYSLNLIFLHGCFSLEPGDCTWHS